MEEGPVIRLVDCDLGSSRTETTEAVREHAVRKLTSAIRRFQHRVRYVTVRLVDLNGPRRGVDTRCSVAVQLVNGGSVFVEATAALPFAAITQAAARASAALSRQTDRHDGSRLREPTAGEGGKERPLVG